MIDCLSIFSRNQTIKICQFDKDNGVALLNSECYCENLDSIVNEPNKFKEINFNLDNNSLEECKYASWIKKANSTKYYFTTYIKPTVDSVTCLKLFPLGSVPGRLYGKAKIHKTGCPSDQSLPWLIRLNIILQNGPILKLYITDSYSLPLTSRFIDKIKKLKPMNDAKLVSFDVTRPFTNVPVDLIIDDIAKNYSHVMSLLSHLFYNSRNQLRKISLKKF